MRSDRGYLCLPEVELGMRLSRPFAELAKCKMSVGVAHKGIMLSHKFDAKTALDDGVVHATHADSALLPAALDFAASQLRLATNPEKYGIVKAELYQTGYAALASLEEYPHLPKHYPPRPKL
jgi:enoyl-CoA hydratase/carnithine racemase